MLICADSVLTMVEGENPLTRGCVRVEGERIVEVGERLEPKEDEDVLEVEDAVLLPGMINAHCHLDYTCFKGAIFRGQGFTEWIKRINALKNSFTPEDYLESIDDGFRMLQRSGCTSVFNIEAFPDLFMKMKRPPLRTWWFLELIDVRTRLATDDMLMGALSFFESHDDWLGGFGLSPHAPYTASVELYRLALKCSQTMDMPFTTHVAESVEEQEMFLYGQGALHDFLEGLGRDMIDCGQGSALSHLMEFGALNEKVLAVHLNYLQEYDWQTLKNNPITVVHCPMCHAYFGHRRFPMEKMREVGCRVCLGTDSLASNDVLDMRAEMRLARQVYPDLSPRELLEMVTVHPAQAIGQGDLGLIRPGALADLVALPLPRESDPYTAVINSTEVPLLTMVNGEEVDLGS